MYIVRLLEYLDNELGTFLIRIPQENKQTSEHVFTLSYLDYDSSKQRHTKNYRIMQNALGEYYITSKKFKNLFQLVKHFKNDSNGITRKITHACPRELFFEGFPVWEEKRSNIKLQDEIGVGNYGKVFKGMWRNQHEIAVKVLKYHERDKQRALNESDLMRKFRHEKIVKLYCVCQQGEPFLIVMEYMSNGSLLKWMRHGAGAKLRINDIINIGLNFF
jgi:tyrosine-protein kinase Src